MAQPSFDSILNAVMLAESGGRRYDEKGRLLTSTKGAKGEMQVLDTTNVKPGFGVEPARSDSPEERARVGRDYLKAMLDRYGSLERALVAYNWGPGNADQWIAKGADLAKLPSETKSYLASVKSRLSQPTTTAKTTPEAAPMPAQAVGAPGSRTVVSAAEPAAQLPEEPQARLAQVASRTAELGPSYQAALALSYLADENEREGREERGPSISQQWLSQPSARSSLADFSLKYRSPFDVIEPQQPVGMADGGEVRRRKLPDPSLMNFKIWAETVSRDMYPSKDDDLKRDAARHMLASAILANRTTPGIAEAAGKAYEFKEAPFKTAGHWLGLTKPRPDYPTDTFNNSLGASMAGLADRPQELQRAVRQAIDQGKANLTPDEVPAMGYEDGGEASAEELERASKPAFGVVPSSGRGRKQGRISETLQSGEAQREFLKGSTLLPQNLVGAPVDLATMAMRPFGYNVEKPVMGSEWLKEKSRQAGVAFPEPTDPTLKGFYTAGDIASNLVNPAAATRTVASGTKKAGQAAKMLAEMAGETMTAPSGTLASQRGAVRLPGGHFIMTGQYDPLTGQTNRVDEATVAIKQLASTKDEALNKWITDKLGAYIRRDMGTENDPFVKMAEEGRRSHIFRQGAAQFEGRNAPSLHVTPEMLRQTRRAEGFPETGFAQTEMGRRMEAAADMTLSPEQLQDLPKQSIPPSLLKFRETHPEMRVQSLVSYPGSPGSMDFNRLRTDMLYMRQMPEVYEAYGETAKVPEQYRFTDKSLQGLTPTQASERVALFDDWMEETNGRLASKAILKEPGLNKKVLDDGSMWVEPPDLSENPSIRELVQAVGCHGKWCTQEEHHALDYGSGENRLAILMPPKGRPVAQVTITKHEPSVDDFLRYGGAAAEPFAHLDIWSPGVLEDIQDSMEFYRWAKSQPTNVSVSEVKGFANATDLQRSPYRKNLQQYIQDLDRQYDLTHVNNLDGMGLLDITSYLRGKLYDRGGVSLNQMKAVNAEARRLNGGSKYINVVSEDNPGRSDYTQVDSIVEQAINNVLKPKE